jgi:hypothetical protein
MVRGLEQGESISFLGNLKSIYLNPASIMRSRALVNEIKETGGASETSTTGEKRENVILMFWLGAKEMTKRRHFRCSKTYAAARTGGEPVLR